MEKCSKYPVLNPCIRSERVQPLFSQFVLEYNGIPLPIYVNPEAAQILRRCNGRLSVEEISHQLASLYSDDYGNVSSIVQGFLAAAENNQHIRLFDTPMLVDPISTIGSTSYWTPDLISIELTHKCPLKCKHCYLSAGNGMSMDSQTLHKIISEAKSMQVAQIQLTGGEPMLHPHFFDTLSECVENGMIVHVFTSGTVYNEKMFEMFSQFDRTRVFFQVSLDGLESYHDDFRGVSGSFKRSCNFIMEIAKLGFKVTVATTIDKQSKEDLSKLIQLCKSIGVGIVRLSGISNRGRAVDNEISSTNARLDDISKLQLDLAEIHNDDHFKVMLLEDTGDNEKVYLMNCGLGQTTIKIAPNGDVFACMMADTPYANIKHETLTDIQCRKSRLFEQLTPPQKEQCKECGYASACDNCIIEGIMYCSKLKGVWLQENEDTLQQIYLN